MKCALSWNLCA